MRNDAWGAVSELAATQHGAFTKRQAALHGVSAKVLAGFVRAGLLVEPRPGVLVLRGAPVTWHQALMLPCLARPDVASSHRSSARLLGLDGYRGVESIEVSTGRRFVSPGVHVHVVAELPSSDVVVIDGLPTTGLARTLCDLGSVSPPELVERALDDARRRNISLLWLRQTAERLHRPGQRGTGALLQLLDDIDPNVRVRDSWFEKLLEDLLRHPDIPPLVRQFQLYDSEGKKVARFDLAVPEVGLGIEAHSREFHFGRAAESRDEDRDHRVAGCGWDTMYLGYAALRDRARAVEDVRKSVVARRALLDGGVLLSSIGP
jgi:hypothetical protein